MDTSIAYAICRKCNKTKSINDFSRRGKKDNRPRTVCKRCCYQAKPTQICLPGFVICSHCGEMKLSRDFFRRGDAIKRTQSHCKKCRSELHGGEEAINRIRIWRKNNPEKLRLQAKVFNHRRRARKNGAEGSFTKEEWLELCNQYSNKCLCCGQKVKLTADHVIPICKGWKNDISNIQPLCLSCNHRKWIDIIDYRYDK